MSDIKYENQNFNFAYRVSAIIFNKEKDKILLMRGNDRNFYMLPGGKVNELENSADAIKREIKEEIGWENLIFDFIGVSEEIIKNNNSNIHQITLTYKCVYMGDIIDEKFKSIESDWINFEWIEINEIEQYEIHPTRIKEFFNGKKSINHIIEEKNI